MTEQLGAVWMMITPDTLRDFPEGRSRLVRGVLARRAVAALPLDGRQWALGEIMYRPTWVPHEPDGPLLHPMQYIVMPVTEGGLDVLLTRMAGWQVEETGSWAMVATAIVNAGNCQTSMPG